MGQHKGWEENGKRQFCFSVQVFNLIHVSRFSGIGLSANVFFFSFSGTFHGLYRDSWLLVVVWTKRDEENRSNQKPNRGQLTSQMLLQKNELEGCQSIVTRRFGIVQHYQAYTAEIWVCRNNSVMDVTMFLIWQVNLGITLVLKFLDSISYICTAPMDWYKFSNRPGSEVLWYNR
jgi:hypothetical protein